MGDDRGFDAPDTRRRLALAGASLGIIGVIALMLYLPVLREAHLYRQRTNEGLGFLAALAGFVVAAGFSLAGSACLLIQAMRQPARKRVPFVAAALMLLIAVTGGAVFGLWVEGHGHRCIGDC